MSDFLRARIFAPATPFVTRDRIVELLTRFSLVVIMLLRAVRRTTVALDLADGRGEGGLCGPSVRRSGRKRCSGSERCSRTANARAEPVELSAIGFFAAARPE